MERRPPLDSAGPGDYTPMLEAPMSMRDRQSLDGDWQFQVDPGATLTPSTLQPDRMIPVPGCWQAIFPDLLDYAGVAWYQREVTIPAAWADYPIRLTFGAVDYAAEVFVNGHSVVSHEGGYLPFSAMIEDQLTIGQRNVIAVRVVDVAHRRIVLARWGRETGQERVEGFDPDEIPHGKQSWYCNVGGLWQSVWLERLPVSRIERLNTRPALDGPRLTITAALTPLDQPADLVIEAQARTGTGPMYTTAVSLGAGAEVATLDLVLPGAELWSPESPSLYHVTARLRRAGRDLDQVTVTTGLRTIAIHQGQLLLNDRPLYLRGALDQDFYPEGVYTPPSDDYLRDQFLKARELGLNCLRLHIKPADPRYLDLADEIGLLIWEEVPSWRTLWPKERQERRGDLPEVVRHRVEATLVGLIERDVNHPSVIAYSIVNEDWGTQLVTSAADRAWLARVYELAKSIEPDRLICDNSPCNGGRGPNVHVRTDIDDFHIYYGMPDHYHAFDAFIDSFAQRPAWSFSPYGDAQRGGDEPLILSEFGNWGLPTLSAMARHWPAARPPWWWQTHAWWHGGSNEPSHPAGLAERFQGWGLDRVWSSVDAFAEATQAHQFAALKAEIEAIRRRPSLRGYVITEFTDCYWEANGLLDFYRQPKSYHADFAAVNGATVLVPEWHRLGLWSTERLQVPVGLAHDGPTELPQSSMTWQLVGGEPTPSPLASPATNRVIPTTAIGSWQSLPPIELTLPATGVATTSRLMITLQDGDGRPVTQSHLDLVIVPDSLARVDRPRRLFVRTPAARAAAWRQHLVNAPAPDRLEPGSPAGRLAHLGYNVVDAPAAAELALATDVDDQLLSWVRSGGSLLYLPAADTVSPFLPVLRRPAPWDGNWISGFHFIKPNGAVRRLPLANPLGFAYLSVLPRAVVTGLADHEHDDLLAGLLVGWCERLAGTIVQFRVGRGRVLLCTFELLAGLGDDPIATVLLHDLIDYLDSPACNPRKYLA